MGEILKPDLCVIACGAGRGEARKIGLNGGRRVEHRLYRANASG